MNQFNTFLSLDTSIPKQLVLVLSTPNNNFISQYELDNFESSLIPAIEQLLLQSSMTLENIDAFILGAGPGSFMGLRLGFSVFRTWAWIYNKPITTISSLNLLLYSLEKKLEDNIIYVPCLDGKMKRVFTNIIYNKKNLLNDSDIFPAQLCQHINQFQEQYKASKIEIIGSGSELLNNLHNIDITSKNPNATIHPICFSYELLKSIPQEKFSIKSQNQLTNIEPQYLRLSAAETALLEKKHQL